mgnify:CR=1 FL=1
MAGVRAGNGLKGGVDVYRDQHFKLHWLRQLSNYDEIKNPYNYSAVKL